MRAALVLASWAGSAAAANCAGGVDVSMTVGDAVAKLRITGDDATAACNAPLSTNSSCFSVGTGYAGVEVNGRRLMPGTAPSVERRLVQLLSPQLPDSLRVHTLAAAGQRQQQICRSVIGSKCKPPVVGPDTVPKYSPSTDDNGCFETDQSMNNCYNYGTDILTNSFAQPGRASGVLPSTVGDMCPPWCSGLNTCDNVQKSAVGDGLEFVGKTLPSSPPKTGHYVALLVTDDHSNFHWIRQDSDTNSGGQHLWSHKPGGTRVRDVDNNGAKITDPSKSDFSPWSEFCGYFHVVPSKVTIK
eukprot:TRINITY_DN39301_c0_g1_i1.p1 TRINITY_DN39301_c0_g1~~TRINITY_DN39301_c0_g1_i1.p1  ORF type:complete len:320 (+),score=107.76 TRINITY_DN39301_c0_g1_i1:62-961(+)